MKVLLSVIFTFSKKLILNTYFERKGNLKKSYFVTHGAIANIINYIIYILKCKSRH